MGVVLVPGAQMMSLFRIPLREVATDEPIRLHDLEKYDALKAAESDGGNVSRAKGVRKEAPLKQALCDLQPGTSPRFPPR
jgi:hypothetical protein